MGNAKNKKQLISQIWLRDSLSAVVALPPRNVSDEKFSVSQPCLLVSSVS